MKITQLILIFSIITYCYNIDDDLCVSEYRRILQSKCVNIINGGICQFNEDLEPYCVTVNCNSGDNTNITYCTSIIPTNYKDEKCQWDSDNNKCKNVARTCNDYKEDHSLGSGNIYFHEDNCEKLSPQDGSNKNWCSLNENNKCVPYFKECKDITTELICNDPDILPPNKAAKCIWDENSNPQCKNDPIQCSNYNILRLINPKTCHLLKANDNYECIYYQGRCTSAISSCSFYDGDEYGCKNMKPLNRAKNEYSFTSKCVYTEQRKCVEVDRTCSDYRVIPFPINEDPSICVQLVPSDKNNKQCYYDEENSKCKERYKTCELYDQKEVDKTQEECEGIKLEDENKECIYIKNETKCITRTAYYDCGAYTGHDKKICESILSSKTNSYCILDKDNKCKEREFYCEQASGGNKYDCLIHAKPFDSNKKCVFNPDNNNCYEVYKGCEDWVKNDFIGTNCYALYTYNGEKCFLDSEKCHSQQKRCEDAKDEDECKLIEKTGVINTERKKCDWVKTTNSGDYKCKEIYKYCSDYRGTDEITCKNIKPYNEKGDAIDIGYKCILTNAGCERVAKECDDAGQNPVLCSLYSKNIENKNQKYCRFYKGKCTEYFKTCESFNGDTNPITSCEENIVQENYENIICEIEDGKCLSKRRCQAYNNYDKEFICQNIDKSCIYDNGLCYQKSKYCNEVIFYTTDKADENYCKSLNTSDTDKICVLKEDKSGCEEIYKESYPIYYALNKNNKSSKLKTGIIQLLLILFSL